MWPFRNQKVPVRKQTKPSALFTELLLTCSLARQIVLCAFEQESHLRDTQIFTIQNYSFSFKAITLQGKIQVGQSINLRVIFQYSKDLCVTIII